MQAESLSRNGSFASREDYVSLVNYGRKIPENQTGSTVAAQDRRIVPIVRLAFYFYVATIPFETIDLGVPVELTTLSLGLFLATLVFQFPLVLKKPPLAFCLYFLYLLIFALPVYLSTPAIYFEEAKWQMFVLGQLVIMSWAAFNIMKSERAARGMLLTLGFSCALLAVLQQFGITDKFTEGDKLERVSALGFHPNNIARILSLGLLALAGLVYGMRKSIFKPRYVVWACVAVIGFSVVQTGSRGGLLALAAGLLVFTLKDGAVSVKVRNAAIVLIALIFFTVLVFQSEMNRSRFESAVEEGKLARREQIYPVAFTMFLQKPLFGWGAKVGEYELGARLAHVDENNKNPHNLILYALLSSGAVGAMPLFLGIFLTAVTAWRVRHGMRGILPLAMLTLVLAANMSGVWLHNKLHWLVIAYVLSTPFIDKNFKTVLSRPKLSQ